MVAQETKIKSIIGKYSNVLFNQHIVTLLASEGFVVTEAEVANYIDVIKAEKSLNTRLKSQAKALIDPIRYRAQTLYYGAKTRAKNKRLSFGLTIDWIEEKIRNGKCEVTGIDFKVKSVDDEYSNPLVPSLDRIDSSLGYTIENTQVVVSNYNKFKGEYHTSETHQVIKALALTIA